MTSGIRRRLSQVRDGDLGVALVTVVLMSFGLLSLALVGAHMSMQSMVSAAVDRKRVSAIAAAEAGIDVAFTLIKNGTGNRCLVTGQLPGASPIVGSYSVAVTYYDSSNAVVTCDPSTGPASTATSAKLVSTGSTVQSAYSGAPATLGDRKLTARVTISTATSTSSSSSTTPTEDFVLQSYGPLLLSAGSRILDGTDSDPNTHPAKVYTHSNWECQNSATEIDATVYAPNGTALMRDGCVVLGDLASNGDASLSNSGTKVGGSVYSSGGSLSMDGGSIVEGDAKVNGTITLNNSGTAIYGTQTENAPASSFPDWSQPFPYRWYDSTVWDAAGYTKVVDVGSNCGTVATKASAAPATAGEKIVILGNCTFTGGTITAKTDVALFLKGGYDGTFTVQSDNSSVERNVHFMVPAGSTSAPAGWTPPASCSTGNMRFNGGTSMASSIRFYAYTPCNLTFVPSFTGYGQFVGGTVDTGSSSGLTLYYVDVAVPGDGGTTTVSGVTMVSKIEGA